MGRHNLLPLCKRNNVALVWASETLSHHALGKLRIDCKTYGIPLLLFSSEEHVGRTTGEPSVKVYIIKKSFSGINQVLKEFQEDY